MTVIDASYSRDDGSDGFARSSPPYVLEARVDCVFL